jgi:gallate decarboxylase subunit D
MEKALKTPMELNKGTGRTAIFLSVQTIGTDLLVSLFNAQAHIGAVAVAEFSAAENRASTSIITRLGHKDDHIARSAAHKLCKHLRKPVCVIAGIHLDNITQEEIEQIVQNCAAAVDEFLGKE